MNDSEQKNERKRQTIRAECERRGLTITPRGKAFWIAGQGVSLIVSDLATVSGRELDPVRLFER